LALDMISSNFFQVIESCKDIASLIEKEPAKVAFGFLASVEMQRPKSGKERVKDLHRVRSVLNLEEEEATKLTAQMLSMLPSNVWENASSVGGDEDNLFG